MTRRKTTRRTSPRRLSRSRKRLAAGCGGGRRTGRVACGDADGAAPTWRELWQGACPCLAHNRPSSPPDLPGLRTMPDSSMCVHFCTTSRGVNSPLHRRGWLGYCAGARMRATPTARLCVAAGKPRCLQHPRTLPVPWRQSTGGGRCARPCNVHTSSSCRPHILCSLHSQRVM